jgi:hypothetical protein
MTTLRRPVQPRAPGPGAPWQPPVARLAAPVARRVRRTPGHAVVCAGDRPDAGRSRDAAVCETASGQVWALLCPPDAAPPVGSGVTGTAEGVTITPPPVEAVSPPVPAASAVDLSDPAQRAQEITRRMLELGATAAAVPE